MTAELPRLCDELVRSPDFRSRSDIEIPPVAITDLPERAVQFGTGVFLRGFIEYFLDEANRRGLFGGRLVVVGSTGSGRDRLMTQQDGLYTLMVQGIEAGERRDTRRVVSVVSRALSAVTQWPDVLACARNPLLAYVFSNATEVGIALHDRDTVTDSPPRSLPAKLALFLHERARTFDFDPAYGVTILPCELIENNGARLRALVLELADRWQLGRQFSEWLEMAVPFCDTLVDRIVAGTPAAAELDRAEASLGYRDALLTVTEPYRLFAIACDPASARRLTFAEADPGIILTRDVAPYAERKVRLLNGTHTTLAPLALLSGCTTVADVMADERLAAFVRRVLLHEILPTVHAPDAADFAGQVLDRLANPFMRHALFDVTLEGTAKWRLRVVPSVLRYARDTGEVPRGIALGFASHLLFLRGELHEQRRTQGLNVPPDQHAAFIRQLWHGRDDAESVAELAGLACAHVDLWGVDLTTIPGFVPLVARYLRLMVSSGAVAGLDDYLDDAITMREGPADA